AFALPLPVGADRGPAEDFTGVGCEPRSPYRRAGDPGDRRVTRRIRLTRRRENAARRPIEERSAVAADEDRAVWAERRRAQIVSRAARPGRADRRAHLPGSVVKPRRRRSQISDPPALADCDSLPIRPKRE